MKVLAADGTVYRLAETATGWAVTEDPADGRGRSVSLWPTPELAADYIRRAVDGVWVR